MTEPPSEPPQPSPSAPAPPVLVATGIAGRALQLTGFGLCVALACWPLNLVDDRVESLLLRLPAYGRGGGNGWSATTLAMALAPIVVVPLRTYHRRIAGNNRINTISISVKEASDIARVQRDAQDVLRERRRIVPGEDDDFTIRDMTQIAATMASTTTIMTSLLGAVAAVSLLVGGIGIMNIMLVSVTERTREIGIRLAIGALERQVLTQFLVEAVVLALFGGAIGILLGLGIAAGGAALMDVPFSADPQVVALAFAVSALIGVLFGYFPARRAARLDRIEALRGE